MAQIASASAAAFPLAVQDVLQASLQLRDRFLEDEISEHGLRTVAGRLEAQLDRMSDKHYRNPANRRLARHLQHEQPFLFSLLHCPGLDATNHEAERAIRWMVIARKVWGGNRTGQGPRRSTSWSVCSAPVGSRTRTPLRAWSCYCARPPLRSWTLCQVRVTRVDSTKLQFQSRNRCGTLVFCQRTLSPMGENRSSCRRRR